MWQVTAPTETILLYWRGERVRERERNMFLFSVIIRFLPPPHIPTCPPPPRDGILLFLHDAMLTHALTVMTAFHSGQTAGKYDPVSRKQIGRKGHNVSCCIAWKKAGGASKHDPYKNKRGANGEKLKTIKQLSLPSDVEPPPPSTAPPPCGL